MKDSQTKRILGFYDEHAEYVSVEKWISISDFDFECAFGNTGKPHKTERRT